MTPVDYGVVAGLFVVVNGLIEIIKTLITKTFKKNGNGKSYNNPIDFHMLEAKVNKIEEASNKMISVAEILSYKDTDGIPFCYTPRNLVKLSERSLEKLDVIINLLSKNLNIKNGN